MPGSLLACFPFPRVFTEAQRESALLVRACNQLEGKHLFAFG